MLNYREFVDAVRDRITELVEEEYSVRIMPVRRNNGVILDSMMIARPDDRICPNIYLNPLYGWYQDGMSVSRIADRILMQYRSAVPREEIDVEVLTDRESARENVTYRLINSARNRKLLEEIPHREFLDLSLVYVILIRDEQIGEGAVLVRRDHQKTLNLTDEELDLAARENTPRLLPPDLVSIAKMMEELGRKAGRSTYSDYDMEEASRGTPMYVLTNSDRQFGACYMANVGVIGEAASREEDDLYILPSSVHECMVVPARFGGDPEELAQMVREINRTQVDEEEFLSDSIYHYSRQKGNIDIAA